MDLLDLKANANRDGEAFEDMAQGLLNSLWTALPAIISTDSDGHIATANSAVKLAVTLLDGSVVMKEFPPLDTSPVHHQGGGGHTLTHPIKKGDEGVVLLMNRAQDLWHQKGGVQDPVDNRTHHLSDSRWLPGGRSDPRKLSPAPSTSSSQQRSDDGKHVVDVNKDAGVTHASTQKVLTNVAGADGSGTLHLPDKILKNAKKVLINSVKAPNFPEPGASFANKKLIATKPVGAMIPQISSIMANVLTGGIGSLLSNPTVAANTALLTQATTSMSNITAALGGAGSGVVSAINGLATGAATHQTGVAALSGAALPTGGQYGLADVLAHAQALTQFFGDTVPPSVSLASVMAPLDPAFLTTMQANMVTLTAQVVSAAITPAAATATVNGWTAQLAALIPAATAPLATLQAALPALNLAALAGSASISLDLNELAVAGALSGSNFAALTAAMESIFTPSASDTASIMAFPDLGALSAGALGGFSAP